MTVAVALAVLTVSLADPSAARPGGSTLEVSLDVDGCAFLPRDEVLRLAALELDARVVTPGQAGEQATRVQVTCAESQVELAVSDRLTGKRLTRTMTLGAREANVAARLIAIAVSELVITSWMELTLPRPAIAPTESQPAPPELRRAAQERAQRHLPRGAGTGYVLALGQAVGPFQGVGLAWGGGLRLGWTPGASAGRWEDDGALVWRPGGDFDLTAARTEARSSLGTVRVSIWSTALRASLRLTNGRTWLDLGAGARAGVARLEGIPTDAASTRGGTLAGTWAGPIAYLGVGRHFWRMVAAAGIEAGAVLRDVSGLVDAGSPVAIAGRWLSATLAIGWGG